MLNKKWSLFVLFVFCLAAAFFVREKGVAGIIQDLKQYASGSQGSKPNIASAQQAQAQVQGQTGARSGKVTADVQGQISQPQAQPATDQSITPTGTVKPVGTTQTTAPATTKPAGTTTPVPVTAKPTSTGTTAPKPATAPVAPKNVLPATNLAGMNVLVNKTRALPSNYVPNDLVEVKVPFSFSGKSQKKMMRKEAAAALEKLFAHAKKSGVTIAAVSGYRSYQTQETIFTYNVKTQGREQASKFSAVPGQSEHQTGLAMDISAPRVKYGLEQNFGETPEGKWLAQNAPAFGFILRYPKGKEHITGYSYEPWHFRYVGIEMAKVITEKGWTLEEYLEQNQGNIPQQG